MSWTVDKLNQATLEVLGAAFWIRRGAPQATTPFIEGWDETTGFLIRGWVYARENPAWLVEVAAATLGDVLGLAAQKTTVTRRLTGIDPAADHAGRQCDEWDRVKAHVDRCQQYLAERAPEFTAPTLPERDTTAALRIPVMVLDHGRYPGGLRVEVGIHYRVHDEAPAQRWKFWVRAEDLEAR